MNLHEHLVAEGQAVLEAYWDDDPENPLATGELVLPYTCPLTGKADHAFAMVWVADDARFEHDYVHGLAYLDRLRADEAAAYVPPVPSWSAENEEGNAVRARRRQLLLNSDWTQGADAPLDSTAVAAWAAYRQALRDLTENYATPDLVVWPVDPDGGS